MKFKEYIKPFSIIFPVYFSTSIPEMTLNYYNFLSKRFSQIEIIMIDDGSPLQMDYSAYSNINFLKLKRTKNWNQPAASNTGVRISKHDVIFHCNIDHLISSRIIEYLLKNMPKKGEVFHFKRSYNGKNINSNNNIYVMNKADFGEGYDEDFCGHYGYDDSYFFAIRNLRSRIIDIPLLVLDNKSHGLNRDASHNRKLFDKKMKDAGKA